MIAVLPPPCCSHALAARTYDAPGRTVIWSDRDWACVAHAHDECLSAVPGFGAAR